MNRVVFSLSCAGGRASNYDPWKKKVDFTMVNLEYPGHWERWEECLCDDYIYIIEDLESKILDYIRVNPVKDIYLLGHSLGALFAWLIADRLSMKANVDGIIILAMAAPSRLKKLIFKNLEDVDDIKRFLKDIRQVPEKTLSSNFFMENMFPAIVNDFRLYNKVASSQNIFNKLNIPCLVLYSNEDPIIEVEDVFAWGEYTKQIEYGEMTGNHFFPYSSAQMPIVCERITRFVNSNRF